MKIVAIAAVAVLVVLLIPLIRLAEYAVPWYDDYNYGAFTRTAYEMNPGIVGALKGAWDCIKTQWHAWQGTFSSIFFMALMPAVWGEEWYFIGPVFLILLLTLSVVTAVKVFTRRVLQADKAPSVVLAAGVAAMVLLYIHTAQAGFYWYNAGVHYVGMHSFFLLMIASAICLVTAESKGKMVLYMVTTLLLGFICSGANYVTALQGVLMLLSIIACCVWLRNKRVVLLVPATVAYVIGFYLNVSAPGNSHRETALTGYGMDAVSSVLYSFREAALYLAEFTGVRTILILVLLAPIIYYVVSRTQIRFRYPLVVLLWSFCFYATGFTPSLYSLGHAGLARTLNAVKITYQILLVLNEIYLLGWCVQKSREKIEVPWQGRPAWWFYGVIAFALVMTFGVEDNQAGRYSSYGAYYYVHTGEAYNFHQQYLERVEILKSEEQNVVLEPYVFKPWFLCATDLSDNPEDESNRALASWYDKESVIVQYD